MQALREENDELRARIAELEQGVPARPPPAAGAKIISVEPLRTCLTPEARRIGAIMSHSRAVVSFQQPPLSDPVRVWPVAPPRCAGAVREGVPTCVGR